jgi:hypothetical protein
MASNDNDNNNTICHECRKNCSDHTHGYREWVMGSVFVVRRCCSEQCARAGTARHRQALQAHRDRNRFATALEDALARSATNGNVLQ